MPIQYLKKAIKTEQIDNAEIAKTVQTILNDIESSGEAGAIKYAQKFDNWHGDIVVSDDQIRIASEQIPDQLKRDIRFAHDNIKRFAEAQLATVSECSIEIVPGFFAGQKQIPVSAVGCYVPGGRYSHIASALMTATTAKVAGVDHITACSPTTPGVGIHPAILFTLDICGADKILNLGGIQGIAAMAFGYFGSPKADMLIGPGNQYVAEAKRLLFGRVGIDMFAGPTNSLVIADETADAQTVAWDLAGQAEHGYNSPVWLLTTDRALADEVMKLIPGMIASLPELNAKNAEAAWRDYAEVVLCDDPEQMAKLADEYAPEHLQVIAADLDWWLARLKVYGSLFLGAETTVAFGDKAAGPNHVLPTSGAARYTGGLSVHKLMKTVTWQRSSADGARPIAAATANISREEGMEGHAKTADIRL